MKRAARLAEPERYADGYAHLADELGRLDLLLRLRAAALRRAWSGRPQSAGEPSFVADEEVEWLLSGAAPHPLSGDGGGGGDAALRRALAERGAAIEARAARTQEAGVYLPLPRLVRLFGLSPWEEQALVVCLAPELRHGYDRIYAWLQDDITRKRPSVDLVVELLSLGEAERWRARALLSPQAPLLHAGVLEAVEDPHSPSGSSGLGRLLRVDPRILQHLLGQDDLDARLLGVARLHTAPAGGEPPATEPEALAALQGFARRWAADGGGPRTRTVLHLHGPEGAGKRELALAACSVLGAPLLVVDAERLPAESGDAAVLLRLAFRESLLHQAPLYLAGADAFQREGDAAGVLRAALARTAAEYGWLVFLAGREPWLFRREFEQAVFHSVALAVPSVAVRETAWTRALERALPAADAGSLAPRLAERFRLTPGKIAWAAAAVADCRAVAGEDGAVGFEELAAACRAQARHTLGTLAARVESRHGWDDLVLADDAVEQLRELCAQVRHQHQVYERWGFGRRLARGRGISALFSGPPGTGKTMAAEVVAGDLQLDLYKVDLARVVSKWIGETEKNLSRIFDEAEDSNAILFFDEADALFGRRTEISDAHDRYANVETSYLLQRMEEYGGVVVLASNLRDNMDDAFLRRLRFVVEFPFPDAASRLLIWKTHFPAEAPVGDDVDCELLAERVQVAGGNIRNIVLAAAFLAAADGGVVRMDHLVQGTRREYEKLGKLWEGQVLVPGGRR